MKFNAFTETYKEHFEDYMLNQISHTSRTNLEESMRYSLEAGGKRLRPLILLAVVKVFNESIEKAYPYAAALEMIHTYSLIHDDLPAMDDDDLRRGKPTNHIEYSEATAILAGDALLTKAFELMATGELDSAVKVQLIAELAVASGHEGMVGGQKADIEGEKADLTMYDLEAIHARKTGQLIHFAFLAGGTLSRVTNATLNDLITIASLLGLAYQIRDDILDIQGTEKELGKRVGADVKLGKSTYPALLGLEESHELLQDKLNEALTLTQHIKEREKEFDEELLTSFIDSLALD